MKTDKVALTLLALSAARHAYGNNVPSPVRELTLADFDTHINENSLAIVKFQAEWCGACQAMKDDYEAVALKMQPYEGVLIANVNCPDHMDLCQRFEVPWRTYICLKDGYSIGFRLLIRLLIFDDI